MKYSRDRRLLAHVTELGLLAERPLVLLDVGCRGGIHKIWKEFGSHLRAYGFDPAPSETERLSAVERHEGITYSPLAIGTDPKCTTRLDDFVRDATLDYVDFIKTDTDGHDLEVLRSSVETIETKGVLGLLVEVYFVGSPELDSCTFHNIDRLLKQHEFTICDIDIVRYADPALPLPYDRDRTTTTIRGRPRWADILYLRIPPYTPFEADVIRLIKLACIAQIFRTPDTAATLISSIPDKYAKIDREHCLDLLVPEVDGVQMSYREYMDRFGSDPDWLRPARRGIPGGLDLEGAMKVLATERKLRIPLMHLFRRALGGLS